MHSYFSLTCGRLSSVVLSWLSCNHKVPGSIQSGLTMYSTDAVFDDGDMTTLGRKRLCLKSGRHLAASKSLDQLSLTNSEPFESPVVGASAHPTLGGQRLNKLTQHWARWDYYLRVLCWNNASFQVSCTHTTKTFNQPMSEKIIPCHDFFPPLRRGSHVTSDYTYTPLAHTLSIP